MSLELSPKSNKDQNYNLELSSFYNPCLASHNHLDLLLYRQKVSLKQRKYVVWHPYFQFQGRVRQS